MIGLFSCCGSGVGYPTGVSGFLSLVPSSDVFSDFCTVLGTFRDVRGRYENVIRKVYVDNVPGGQAGVPLTDSFVASFEADFILFVNSLGLFDLNIVKYDYTGQIFYTYWHTSMEISAFWLPPSFCACNA